MKWLNSRYGFSLIELTVVLALISIIVALVSAHGTFFNRMLVRVEVEKLYMICQHMQRCAQVSNQTQEIVFDREDNAYWHNGVKEQLAASVTFGYVPGTHGPPSWPHTLIKRPITFGNQQITFHPDGIIKPGTVYLTDRAHTYMYALSSPIAHVSYLRKYRYDKTRRRLSEPQRE